jgi:hypothetical protein
LPETFDQLQQKSTLGDSGSRRSARTRVRYGYRWVHVLLRREEWSQSSNESVYLGGRPRETNLPSSGRRRGQVEAKRLSWSIQDNARVAILFLRRAPRSIWAIRALSESVVAVSVASIGIWIWATIPPALAACSSKNAVAPVRFNPLMIAQGVGARPRPSESKVWCIPIQPYEAV